MHQSGPPPPQNSSCLSPSLAQCPSPSPSLLQQQQHVLYGPITSLQPCTTSLHPHCVYPGVQRNLGLSGTSAPLSNQVPIRQTKMTKWQPKSKPARGHQHHHLNQYHHHHHHHQRSNQQQYCQPIQHQQTHIHQPLSYIPKPLVLFDQCPTNQPPPGLPPSATSFLVASSTFAHAPYGPGDPYATTSGLTLIPQPYFKTPEVPQAFCLLSDLPQTTQHHQQPLVGQTQGSYYNISATNACNLQPINPKPTFQLTSLTNPYGNVTTFGTSQITASQALPASQIFQNPTVSATNFGTTPRDKLSMLSNVDVQAMTCSRNLTIPGETRHQGSIIPRTDIDWTTQTTRETSSNIFEVPDAGTSSTISLSPIQTNRLHSTTITKNQDEHYSDESAASFDFTIEAEKMVSALCNTASSNDLGKDEARGRNEQSALFGGAAGDNVTNKTNAWFADFCNEYGVSVGQSNRTVSTQTQEDKHDSQHYPEMMRKTIYWGCNEAESVLNSSCYRGSLRAKWLENISCATRTAVTKSSTCFPIYSGDKIFVQDLVNALLRISNGWLVLDNYLNKQHYPNVNEKFDRELTRHFQTWQVSTLDLMRELVKTFVNLEENSNSNCSLSLEGISHQENSTNMSFPGDVNLYTSNDLFDSSQRHQNHSSKLNNCPRTERDSTYTLQYAAQSTNHPNFHSYESQRQSQKHETKLRSKWTITENLSSTIDGTKSVPDISIIQTDPGFSGNGRFRVKNSSNASTTKITSSSRHSLNAEFFHLRNKVMESMGNSNETDRQRWDLKEQQYDFVFGTSRGNNSSAIVPVSCEPMFKIKATESSYENSYTRRCPPRVDSTNPVNQTTKNNHCANNMDESDVGENVTALDSTYIGGVATSKDRNKTYTELDCAGINVRTSELNEHNCGSGPVVSTESISSVRQEPVYVGKSELEERPELATVPTTKMTLLSQIEGNTTNTNKDTKEMTANLSAWFASMRNSNGHRTINCPVEGRKNDNITITRTSSHPQETSRSAMDLNRQLHMDGNRQLQTIQNMQAIQSQPWNASNLLNNKRTSNNVHRQLDEYDSSEDVRVYMKPGSYNVPKKRHHRKNNRRGDNPASSRVNNNTPRVHTNRDGYGESYNANCGIKNHQVTSAISSLLIASSVQVSTTTTATTTTIRVPFPDATPIVKPPPPANFSLQNSPRILRRARSFSNQETRQDVAWKAACASAEILLEALNIKASTKGQSTDSKSPNSMKNAQIDFTPRYQDDDSLNELACNEETARYLAEDHFDEASSYEGSEDDSSSTCKFSPNFHGEEKSSDSKQPRTNVKTDSWLIRTLNNASIVSTINTKESDAESTIDGSFDSSIHVDHREHKSVVTSTPEPVKMSINDNGSRIVARKLDDSFQEKSIIDSPRESENRERSRSNTRQTPSRTLSASLIDTSDEFVSRATYSETVRRSTGKSCTSGKTESCRSRQTRSVGSIESMIGTSMLPVTGKKFQRKENDKVHQLINKSKKIVGKKLSRDIVEKEIEEKKEENKIVTEDASGESLTKHLAVKNQTKKKDDGRICGGWTDTKGKCNERGWSIWYSSRRKQTLSSLALNKLATIHQTIWQMDDAKLMKYPSSGPSGSGAINETIENDCKVVKSPIFLETIGYKLKNRIYHKVEQAIRDFRRIVNNSKLHHKNDTDHIAKIETLSKKLEELFEEHFTDWDFENIPESPRNNNGLSSVQTSKCKSPQRQQQESSRPTSMAKKNSATLTKNEN